MKKILLLLLITIAGCASVSTDAITITGIAGDSKAGPVVNCDGNQYYIDDVVYWGENYINKKVSVTGILVSVPNPEPKDNNVLVQRRSGTEPYLFIKNAKWVLAE
jgi:uncharacterized protein YceK